MFSHILIDIATAKDIRIFRIRLLEETTHNFIGKSGD